MNNQNIKLVEVFMKISIEHDLKMKLISIANAKGYLSLDEFIIFLLEKEVKYKDAKFLTPIIFDSLESIENGTVFTIQSLLNNHIINVSYDLIIELENILELYFINDLKKSYTHLFFDTVTLTNFYIKL